MTYNGHSESRGSDELRLSQLDEVLSDAARYEPHWFVVMAGDPNLNVSKKPRRGYWLARDSATP